MILAPDVGALVTYKGEKYRVTGWICEMKTDGYREGDVQLIPFKLAPRVIDRMKKLNPKLTLVGCKMTSGASREELVTAAYQTLLKAHCNVVVANDLSDLKRKLLVYPDGRVEELERLDSVAGPPGLYGTLEPLLCDQYYSTKAEESVADARRLDLEAACKLFDALCDKYRERFKKRPDSGGPERVFGSLAVRIDENHVLVSPREKGLMFDSKDAAVFTRANKKTREVFTVRGKKATLNAPLLVRLMNAHMAHAVVHLHEERPEWPTQDYAPPGTARDNERDVTNKAFNIKGHGCVFIEEGAKPFQPDWNQVGRNLLGM
jgi:hypothetical protein